MQLKELGLAVLDHDFEVFLDFLRPNSLEADYQALLLKWLQTQVILVQEDEIIPFRQQWSVVYQTGSAAIPRSLVDLVHAQHIVET